MKWIRLICGLPCTFFWVIVTGIVLLGGSFVARVMLWISRGIDRSTAFCLEYLRQLMSWTLSTQIGVPAEKKPDE